MTQKDQIRRWLDRGYGITQAQAYEKFGCWRLSQRIIELEQDGYKIHRDRIAIKRSDGSKAHVTRYSRRKPSGADRIGLYALAA